MVLVGAGSWGLGTGDVHRRTLWRVLVLRTHNRLASSPDWSLSGNNEEPQTRSISVNESIRRYEFLHQYNRTIGVAVIVGVLIATACVFGGWLADSRIEP